MRFPIFCEDGSNIYDNATYISSATRLYGNQPNTSADSKMMNSFMKSASLLLNEIAKYDSSNADIGPQTSTFNIQIPTCKYATASSKIGFEVTFKPTGYYHLQLFLKTAHLDSDNLTTGSGLSLLVDNVDSGLGNVNTSIPSGDIFSFDWMIDIYYINGQLRALDRASNTYNLVESLKQGYYFNGYSGSGNHSVRFEISGVNTQQSSFDFHVTLLSSDIDARIDLLDEGD